MEPGKSNYKRLTAKAQVAKIEKEKLDEMTLRFLAYRAVVYSNEFN